MRFLLRFHTTVFQSTVCGSLQSFKQIHYPHIPNKRLPVKLSTFDFSLLLRLSNAAGPPVKIEGLRLGLEMESKTGLPLRVGLMPPFVRFSLAANLALAEDRRPLISLWTYISVCQSTLKGSRMLFVLR